MHDCAIAMTTMEDPSGSVAIPREGPTGIKRKRTAANDLLDNSSGSATGAASTTAPNIPLLSRTTRRLTHSNEHSMPSPPIRIDQSLQNELLDSFKDDDLNDAQTFLPADQLDILLAEKRVNDVLTEAGIDPEDILRYTLRSARKTLATLICIGKASSIQDFHKEAFTDDDLPVHKENHPSSGINLRSSQIKRTLFQPLGWNHKNVLDFCQYQWNFLAPVFQEHQFEYLLHPRCPLPFIKKDRALTNSNFSTVYKIEIHPAHMKVQKHDNGTGSRMIAVKSLRKDDTDKKDRYTRELDVLDITRSINHTHLINAIAAYTRGDDRCFIFPWAEGGNLREFWKEHTRHQDPRNGDLISWVMEEFHGLFDALRTLHYWDDKRNCRHGDLKPENILLFFWSNGRKVEGRGVLVIADVGLTKFHSDRTSERRERTGTWTGTQKYEPPEITSETQDSNQPRSRLYDTWSMGCIALECIIWLLYGPIALERFNSFDKFWHERDHRNCVHSEVDKWITYMVTKDARCSEGTAVRDLLDFVSRRLLVVEHTKGKNTSTRAYANEAEKALRGIVERMKQSPSYLCKQGVWDQNKGQDGPPRTVTQSIGGNLNVDKPPQRSLPFAPVINEEFMDDTDLSFSIQVDQVDTTDFVDDARLENGEDEGNGDNTGEFLHALNDIWECEADNEFARKYLSSTDHSYILPRGTTHSLCDICAKMNIWAPGFERKNNKFELLERARSCQLCKMLLRIASQPNNLTSEVVHFYRSGSSLKLNLSGPPLLSIYITPETKNVPSYAQVGLPRLPKAGTEAQLNLMRAWLKNCDDSHPLCLPKMRPLPTRVIDVGYDKLSKDLVRLHAPAKGQVDRYIALSHCWGTTRQFCLLSSNIEALNQGIEVASFSRTFQDAITVTRALGIRYMWIDSLCIIQDSPSDWNVEAALMNDVYSSAYLTIAASSSSGGEGFLSPRPPRQFVSIETPGSGPLYICEAIDDFKRDVEEGALNQRGWVLQERALSHRTLHFTSQQIYWECGKGIRTETLSKLLNSKAAFLGDPEFPKSSLKYLKGGRIRLFELLFEHYCRLAFTRSTDRAVAIIGLEKRLLDTFETQGGFGILDSYFHRSLLWQRVNNKQSGSSDIPQSQRPDYASNRPVPTWSWMSITGPISYLDVPLGGAAWDNSLQSPFKSVAASSPDFHWQIDKEHPRLEIKGQARKFVLTRSNTLKRMLVMDADGGALLEDARCVVIGKEKTLYGGHDAQKYYIMVVVPRRGGDEGQALGFFERAGVGIVERRNIEFMEKGEEVVIV